jgi:flagellar FliJ protein
MKFHFPFEKLLEHRQRQEDEAQRIYLIAQNQLEAAQAELRAMYESITRTRQQAGFMRSAGGSVVGQLVQTDEFISGQEVRITRQKERIRELASVAEEKHAILVEASQEVKKVTKLREKMFERFKDRLKKLEAKELDDIVTMGFGREKI